MEILSRIANLRHWPRTFSARFSKHYIYVGWTFARAFLFTAPGPKIFKVGPKMRLGGPRELQRRPRAGRPRRSFLLRIHHQTHLTQYAFNQRSTSAIAPATLVISHTIEKRSWLHTPYSISRRQELALTSIELEQLSGVELHLPSTSSIYASLHHLYISHNYISSPGRPFSIYRRFMHFTPYRVGKNLRLPRLTSMSSAD